MIRLASPCDSLCPSMRFVLRLASLAQDALSPSKGAYSGRPECAERIEGRSLRVQS